MSRRACSTVAGDVQTGNASTEALQIPCNMSGAAAHVTNFALHSNCLRETAKEFPVEWLAFEFVINPAGIFVCDLVVALADRTLFLLLLPCLVVSHGRKGPAR